LVLGGHLHGTGYDFKPLSSALSGDLTSIFSPSNVDENGNVRKFSFGSQGYLDRVVSYGMTEAPLEYLAGKGFSNMYKTPTSHRRFIDTGVGVHAEYTVSNKPFVNKENTFEIYEKPKTEKLKGNEITSDV
jgi:hypothetical protein